MGRFLIAFYTVRACLLGLLRAVEGAEITFLADELSGKSIIDDIDNLSICIGL
tara:strand:+ start:1369 stop:1527 length:159 start_codon:yes stop_codon:yes gene_type:complete